MIRVENVSKSFGHLQVLDSVSLQVEDASVVSITGASGAGKTTLLQIMGSLDRPDSGKVLMGDTDIYALSSRRLSAFRNTRIGFVFQFHYLLPEFTALENVMMPALIGGKERRQAETDAADLLEFLGLGSRMGHKPSELSGGEQQRVAVARALVNRPEVVFADEPSGNLDTANALALHKLFFDLRDRYRQTFVIVTHNPDLAAMSDRCIEMKDGRISKRC
ncbi:MAG: ABC transporter ATP-binding protein [Bacteroidetes bacterium]|uniref:ABC transporter ATP-binding protein n=1 Tax=Candidatus Pullibacteroides excrementavium TaxID=2840905 RepID=A0A9D9DSC8_9BACT|nr:ABC transporter ATP-binding protein [Candidatus Pullibacteroides excrementavium]